MSIWIRRALSSRTLFFLQQIQRQFRSVSHLSSLNSILSSKESSLVGSRFGSDPIFFANRRGFAKGKKSNHSFLLRRTFSAVTSKLPPISDPEVESAFKDLMAMSWDQIPDSVISSTKKALSKDSTDKAGQEALENLFRAAEASVEFGGVLVSLRMALDDLNGITGEVSLGNVLLSG